MRLYVWLVAVALALTPVVAGASEDWLVWLIRWLTQQSGGWWGY